MIIAKEQKLQGVVVLALDAKRDSRGYFMRVYDRDFFREVGIDHEWLQENHSRSEQKYIIRGLHFQFAPFTETKLIRVIRGAIMDVFVDLRYGSPTFGVWDAVELSESSNTVLYIPRGFAHGFCTLTDITDVTYKVDSPYAPSSESGIRWDDPTLKIAWPSKSPFVSDRDRGLGYFADFVNNYGALETPSGVEDGNQTV